MRAPRQSSPPGAGTPLNPNVYDSRATSATGVGISVTASASAGVRADPAWRTPAASRAASVRSMPAAPWSNVWLEAVEQASNPVPARAGAISGGTENVG